MGHGDRPPTTRSLPVPSVCELWTRSWPYGLSTVLYPIYFQASTVLVKHLSTNEAAGMFGLGATVLTAVYLLPTTIYQKFLLSKLHRWATYDQRRFWSVYRQGILAMLLAGAAIGALLAATGPTAVAIAFGVQYSPVGRIVQCLAICVPLRFVTTAIGSALLNEAQMRFRVLAMASSAIVVVLVNLVAVPNLVEFGAVIAMIAGEATLLIMMTLGVRHSRVRPNAA